MRVEAAASNNAPYKQQMMAKALDQLQSAIELLDRADAPGQIAAHVDLAINRLERLLSTTEAPQAGWLESDSEAN